MDVKGSRSYFGLTLFLSLSLFFSLTLSLFSSLSLSLSFFSNLKQTCVKETGEKEGERVEKRERERENKRNTRFLFRIYMNKKRKMYTLNSGFKKGKDLGGRHIFGYAQHLPGKKIA